MAAEIHWPAIALRLILTVIAGGLLGVERSRTGHAAGLRTTLLVTLAASVSMIQMNLLMWTNGKPHDSYAVMDVMRLPLGILTGVGFIGAGAIIRRKNELVLGLTTAATLWFATVVGLCLGGGQLILGSVATIVGFVVLWGFRWFENRAEKYHRAELRITIAGDSPSAEDLRARLQAAEFHIRSLAVNHSIGEGRRKLDCEVRWPRERGNAEIAAIVNELGRLPGIVELEWRGVASGPQ
ncbi:MAG TPA: MgtC/SapB family protein [Terriglobia bacterium]|nr:MgtC/SapB family protein [Terriglobia bacterium]